MTLPGPIECFEVNGVPVEATFAEAFDMKATRLILTADDPTWARHAAAALTGFGTSVIACGVEIAVECELDASQTPDSRPGLAVLAFAMSGSELEKQIPRRVGQCVLTCPTTALYAGVDEVAFAQSLATSRIPLGKSIRYFGDGRQISKVIDGVRFWRIPVMDGEFVCQHDVARFGGIGGGNFLVLGDSIAAVSDACRAAVAAIADLPGVITPFPGGVTRSGSKVGSRYRALFASTNEAYCPTLQYFSGATLGSDIRAVLEIVIDGVDAAAVAQAMRVGVLAATARGRHAGVKRITAGNYGGKLGRHHFHLAELLEPSAGE